MQDLRTRVYELMLTNRRRKGKYQYTLPSPDSYPYQWLWDSCFHAIILTHYNTEDAKKELLSLVAKQFTNGMIPHMNYWQESKKKNFPKIDWGGKRQFINYSTTNARLCSLADLSKRSRLRVFI
jgi:hypothetical protein